MSIEPLEVPPSSTTDAAAPRAAGLDSVTAPPVEGPTTALPAPDEPVASEPSRRERRDRSRFRARKVTRVIRRVQPWSVLKVSVVLYLCLWLVLTVAGVILWQVARATGTLDNLEDFLASALADTSFTIDGRGVLLASLTGGVVLVFAGTALTVLLAILFNLVSELTGGVRVSVVELETAAPVEGDVGSPDAEGVR
jgi:hypothetical protein